MFCACWFLDRFSEPPAGGEYVSANFSAPGVVIYAGYLYMTGKITISESTLRELYCDKNMSMRQIADRLGCSTETVRHRMHEYGIPTRSRSEASRLANLQSSNVSVWFDWYNGGYERVETWYDGERYRFSLHRLVAVSEYGLEAVRDMDVHHRNGCKFDNRPENLELLPHDEHSRITMWNRYHGQEGPESVA